MLNQHLQHVMLKFNKRSLSDRWIQNPQSLQNTCNLTLGDILEYNQTQDPPASLLTLEVSHFVRVHVCVGRGQLLSALRSRTRQLATES